MTYRLLRHGLLLFFLALVTGFAVPEMVNPRAGVAGHVEGLMNGMFLVVVGLAWPALRLSERAGRVVSWLLTFGTYANWAATTASGVLGTSKGTPVAGAGFQGSPLAESAVFGVLVLVGLSMTAACAVLVSRAWRAAPSALAESAFRNNRELDRQGGDGSGR
jgi:hydroxylaminobenzene mutase